MNPPRPQGKPPGWQPPRWGLGNASAPFAKKACKEWTGRDGHPPPEGWESIYAAAFAAALNPVDDQFHWHSIFPHEPRFAAFALEHAGRMVDGLSDRALCRIVALGRVPPFWMKAMSDPLLKVEAHVADILESARQIRPGVAEKAARNAWEAIRREQAK